MTTQPTPAETVADHLARCTPAHAAIVMQSGSADDTIAELLAAGWTLDERVDFVAGKRIRFLVPPPEVAERLWPATEPEGAQP